MCLLEDGQVLKLNLNKLVVVFKFHYYVVARRGMPWSNNFTSPPDC